MDRSGKRLPEMVISAVVTTRLKTSLGLIILETAPPEELPVVMGILDECAAWLHSKGIAQWALPQPPHEWEKMKRQIEMGHISLARLETDRQVVGTLRIEWEDSLWSDDAQAGYVHSLAIRNDFRGHRIGEKLLDWAQGQIAARGWKYIRLDCWTENTVLRRYYEGLGFRHCGDVEYRGWTGALYEKEAVPQET